MNAEPAKVIKLTPLLLRPRPAVRVKPGEKLADVVLLKPAHRFDLFFGSITGVAW